VRAFVVSENKCEKSLGSGKGSSTVRQDILSLRSTENASFQEVSMIDNRAVMKEDEARELYGTVAADCDELIECIAWISIRRALSCTSCSGISHVLPILVDVPKRRMQTDHGPTVAWPVQKIPVAEIVVWLSIQFEYSLDPDSHSMGYRSNTEDKKEKKKFHKKKDLCGEGGSNTRPHVLSDVHLSPESINQPLHLNYFSATLSQLSYPRLGCHNSERLPIYGEAKLEKLGFQNNIYYGRDS
jgi:hypothetical protein